MNAMLHLSAAEWLQLFVHFTTLSLMAVGGAITTAPDMHRFLIVEHEWLTDAQFNASIAMAQAAPGPNVLFVALLGWHVGLNQGSIAWALWGVLVCMVAIMVPSSLLTYAASRWGHRNRNLRAVRAFKQGMAPVVIALLIATGWILASAQSQAQRDWPLWLVTAASAWIVWRTRLHLLWLLGAGAVIGALGWL